MANAYFQRADDVPEQQFDWGKLRWFASGSLGNSKDMTIGQCIIKPGCENPRHSHPDCEEALHVLSGKVWHSVKGEDDYEMNVGDTIVIPPNVVHNARNIASADAVLMIAFSTPERKTVGE